MSLTLIEALDKLSKYRLDEGIAGIMNKISSGKLKSERHGSTYLVEYAELVKAYEPEIKEKLYEYIRRNPGNGIKKIRADGFGNALERFHKNRSNDARREAGVPAIIKQYEKLPDEEWETRKQALYDCLRENPDISISDLRGMEIVYISTLQKFHKGKGVLKQAKKAAGVAELGIRNGQLKDAMSIVKGFSKTIQKYYQQQGLPVPDMDDLVQEGMIGWLRAEKDYNPDRGTKFITYARNWIRGYIRECITESTITNTPPTVYYSMKKAIGNSHVDFIDYTNITERTSLSDKTAHALLRNMRNPVSLDSGLGQKQESWIKDKISFGDVSQPEIICHRANPEELLMEFDSGQRVNEYIKEILAELSPREIKVIRERYGFDGEEETLQEIGIELGISRSRVEQIEKKVLRNIRIDYRTERMREYL